MSDEEITVTKMVGYLPYSLEQVEHSVVGAGDGHDLSALVATAPTAWTHPNYVPPKPWEGPPITPLPMGYQAMLDEFPASRTAAESALFELIELHGPNPSWVNYEGIVGHWVCEGCDAEGYDAEYPTWPCRTTALIARHLGMEVPE